MAPMVKASLDWQGGLKFRATLEDGRAVDLDGGKNGGLLSPVDLLVVALAGCMAVDVVHILGRAHAEVTGLATSISAERNETDPRYVRRAILTFKARGRRLQAAAVERAIQLSKEKYCSVLHSLRQDLDLVTAYEISGP